jgi:hypothetical protein
MNISNLDGSALIAAAAFIFGLIAFLVLFFLNSLRKDPKWDKLNRFH